MSKKSKSLKDTIRLQRHEQKIKIFKIQDNKQKKHQ